MTSKDKLYIIKPIEIVGNTKIPAEAQHNRNRNAKASAFLFWEKNQKLIIEDTLKDIKDTLETRRRYTIRSIENK